MKVIFIVLLFSWVGSGSYMFSCNSLSKTENNLEKLVLQNQVEDKKTVCWKFYIKSENEFISESDRAFLSKHGIYILENPISSDVSQLQIDPSKFLDMEDLNTYIDFKHGKTPALVFIIKDINTLKILEYISKKEFQYRRFTSQPKFD